MLCLFHKPRPQVGPVLCSLRMLREHLRCCLISQCLEEGACGDGDTGLPPGRGFLGWGRVWSVLVKTTQDTSPAPIFRGETKAPKWRSVFSRSHHNLETSHLFPLYSFPSLPMFSFVCLFVYISHLCLAPGLGDSVVCDHRPCGSTNLSSVPSAITSRLCHPTGISECFGAFKSPWETALMQQPA